MEWIGNHHKRLAYTEQETCDLLGECSPHSLNKLKERFKVRALKIGRTRMWPATEIDRVIWYLLIEEARRAQGLEPHLPEDAIVAPNLACKFLGGSS